MSPSKLCGVLIGGMLGLVVLLIAFAMDQDNKDKFKAAEVYNKYAFEVGAKTLTPLDFDMLDTEDIRDMYTQLKYGIKLNKKLAPVPVYMYYGSQALVYSFSCFDLEESGEFMQISWPAYNQGFWMENHLLDKEEVKELASFLQSWLQEQNDGSGAQDL